LVKEGSGIGAEILFALDISLKTVRQEIEKLAKSESEMALTGRFPYTPKAKTVLEYATEEARSLNHNYVGTEHLLMGMIREHDGVAGQILTKLGLEEDNAREELSVAGRRGYAKQNNDEPTRGSAPRSHATRVAALRRTTHSCGAAPHRYPIR